MSNFRSFEVNVVKKYFLLLFLASVVATGSIILYLVSPNNSLLSPSPANAQQVDIRNGYVRLTLPSTGNQNDSWSCGPNSAARVLAFYGHRVNYEQVRSVSQRDKGIVPSKVCIGSGFLKKCADTSGFKTGFEPWELRDVMNRWEGGNAKYERGADLGKLKSLLSQGKPVLVLRRVGSFKPGVIFGTWPEMHWVTVHGFDDQASKIYFTDTNGLIDERSYDEFLREWDWRIGDGLASETFHRKGVKPTTMVWVDKTPPSIASSSITPLGKLVKLRNRNWGRCLNLQNATQNGVATNAWECVSHPDQEWKIEDAGNGFVKLRNKNWGRCLNLQNATQNGVAANAWECVSHPDQEWKIEDAGNGFVQLRNKNWGRCLNLQNATQNGVAANAWECVSHPDQEWKIESAG